MRGKLLVTGLMTMFTLMAADPAQWGNNNGRYGDPRGWGGGPDDRGGPYDRRGGGGMRGGDPVSAAMRNLQEIGYRARVDNHEANHFRNAMRDLDTFQERWSRGKFDRGKLDNAIGHMEHLANADQLHPRDRAVLRNNLRGLYSLREGRGGYGNGNGYGRGW